MYDSVLTWLPGNFDLCLLLLEKSLRNLLAVSSFRFPRTAIIARKWYLMVLKSLNYSHVLCNITKNYVSFYIFLSICYPTIFLPISRQLLSGIAESVSSKSQKSFKFDIVILKLWIFVVHLSLLLIHYRWSPNQIKGTPWKSTAQMFCKYFWNPNGKFCGSLRGWTKGL